MAQTVSQIASTIDTRPSSSGASGGRARILDVARAAFVERGFADVSMQEIANAAGLTKAAIYYHFADKETLFQQVVTEEIARICVGLEAQLALGPPLCDQLERVARVVLESGQGDFGRLFEDAHRYCTLDSRSAIKSQIARPFALIRDAFVAAQERGEIRDVDPDVTISLFFSMVGSQMKGAEFSPASALSPAELARRIADLVMHGIATDASSPPATTP
jgi:AcrR family transcriptional regulator